MIFIFGEGASFRQLTSRLAAASTKMSTILLTSIPPPSIPGLRIDVGT